MSGYILFTLVMELEIAYAAEAGLDDWAFVDYWDQGNLGIALRRYREAHNKRVLGTRCLGTRCHATSCGRLAKQGKVRFV